MLQQLQRLLAGRFTIIFLQLIIIICLLLFRYSADLKPTKLEIPSNIPSDSNVETLTGHLSLVDLDGKYSTTKGRIHRYTRFYEKYLSKYRNTNFNLLEIGLGCGMSWGVGVSAALWREYFGPLANIHFLEFDQKCGMKWSEGAGRELNVTMHYGSQDDLPFLEAFAAKYADRFDTIIDDGGHRMTQQINSFTTLFPTVLREHGTYAIEDIYTSYLPEYDGGYLKPSTLIEFLKKLIDDMQSRSPTYKNSSLGHLIHSFEISDKLCLLTKR